MVHDWKVGQEVYVFGRYLHSQYRKITKIGRRWAYLGDPPRSLRFDLITGAVDAGDYVSTARAYVSKERFDQMQERTRMWFELSRAVRDRSRPPDSMPTGRIRQIINDVTAKD